MFHASSFMLHDANWDFLTNSVDSGTLGHAYLFSGQDSQALKRIAKDLVAYVSCFSTSKPCAEATHLCQNCRMLQQGVFADTLTINSLQSKSSQENEKDMMEIDVAQIRQAQQFLAYKSYYGGHKSVILEDADRMNVEAQNCFLKNLEEPRGNTLVILLSTKPDMLLPTIVSRCQQIKFTGAANTPEPRLDVAFRNMMTGSLAEKFNYVKSANLDNEQFRNVVGGMLTYFRNALLAKVGASQSTTLPQTNYTIEKLASIIRLIEDILHRSRVSTINQKLALEIILLEI